MAQIGVRVTVAGMQGAVRQPPQRNLPAVLGARSARGRGIPFSSAVPFGGQTIQIPSSLSPKRDCVP